MAIDPEEKTGMLGCLSAIGAIAVVGGGVFWFSQQDFTSDSPDAGARSSAPSSSSRSGMALTRVDPLAEKTVVKQAANMTPLAKKIDTGETEEPPPPQRGVVALVQGLEPVTQEPPRQLPASTAVFEQVLASDPLCYEGRLARRVPSLFTKAGFAITYGADDFNSGDPLPRLEIFLDNPAAPTSASYLSMTHRTFPEFPNNHEVPIPYNQEAIGSIIAKWVATVATETCPDKAPGRSRGQRDGQVD